MDLSIMFSDEELAALADILSEKIPRVGPSTLDGLSSGATCRTDRCGRAVAESPGHRGDDAERAHRGGRTGRSPRRDPQPACDHRVDPPRCGDRRLGGARDPDRRPARGGRPPGRRGRPAPAHAVRHLGRAAAGRDVDVPHLGAGTRRRGRAGGRTRAGAGAQRPLRGSGAAGAGRRDGRRPDPRRSPHWRRRSVRTGRPSASRARRTVDDPSVCSSRGSTVPAARGSCLCPPPRWPVRSGRRSTGTAS